MAILGELNLEEMVTEQIIVLGVLTLTQKKRTKRLCENMQHVDRCWWIKRTRRF